MKSAKALLTAGLFCALSATALIGCETGRVNKLHSRFEQISDVSTVPHQNPQFATNAKGIPPVPGSPTASSPEGMQPSNDNEARTVPATEKGKPTPPREQVKDKFIRQ
jgi:hypothetical protein